MQQINLAHVHTQGIDIAVFGADATTNSDSDRANVLQDLTLTARRKGLKVDKSALAFVRAGEIRFYGTPDLVNYLARSGVPNWTHTITV
jgi:hypothetical protein